METDGGGWTLVWSYTFTNYQSFSTPSNAITPRPTWDVKNPDKVDVPTYNTPPLNETDFNAIEFSKWAIIGDKVLIKSNINNWIICSGTGSLPQWQYGSANCIIAKHITENWEKHILAEITIVDQPINLKVVIIIIITLMVAQERIFQLMTPVGHTLTKS